MWEYDYIEEAHWKHAGLDRWTHARHAPCTPISTKAAVAIQVRLDRDRFLFVVQWFEARQ